jgi:PKD repeat protein
MGKIVNYISRLNNIEYQRDNQFFSFIFLINHSSQIIMKKIKTFYLTILFGCILFTGAHSQVTYNSTDFADVDDNFMVSKANSGQLLFYDFQQTGADHVWLYDTLSANTQKYQTYIDPDNSGYKNFWIMDCTAGGGGAMWCNNAWNDTTNLCMISEDTLVIGPLSLSNIASLYKKNPQVLEKSITGMTVGFGSLPIKMITNYISADTIFKFPMQYLNNDSVNSAYNIDFNSIGVDIIIKNNQIRVNYVEGWGSLSTPYKTYSSVLKMKTLIYHNDSVFLYGTPTPPNQTVDVIYQWFDPAFGISVLTVEGKIAGSTETYSSASYIDSVRCLQPNAYFAYIPLVPYLNENGNADVTFTNLSNNSDIYDWDFGDGSTSVQTNPTHTFTSAGTFPVQLVAANSVCSPYLYDTLIIPIVVKNPVQNITVDLKVFLEGAFNGTDMNTSLNSGYLLPLMQPYNVTPWLYPGTETVPSIPNSNIVDWILVEFRDAADAASATAVTRIARQAGFLLNNGSIVGTDGISPLVLSVSVTYNLFAIVWHNNHLGVISASPLTEAGGIYSHDFTTGSAQAYGNVNAHKQLAADKWGMFSGDGDASNTVNTTDKTVVWKPNAGKNGYLNADFNRNGQVNNHDKNDKWLPNQGKSCQVP